MTVRWFDLPPGDWTALNANLRRLVAEINAGGGGGGGGVTDGDKGDIVVSGSGATWTIDPAILTAAGRDFLNDSTTAEQRATLGLRVVTGTFTITPAQFHTATVSVATSDAAVGRHAHVVLVPNTDHDADDLADVAVSATCAAGTLTITLGTTGPLVGTYAFHALITGP